MSTSSLKSLKAIAIFKASKATAVLATSFGLMSMVHRDVAATAQTALHWLHLDPEGRISKWVVERAGHITPDNLWLMVSLCFAYSLLNGTEAVGLWRHRPWAEWLTLGNGAIYMPAEIHEICRKPTWFNVGALIVSASITVYMAWLLYESRKLRKAGQRPA